MIKKILLISIFFLFAAIFASPVRAEDTSAVTVATGIIDARAKAREILEYDLVLKNGGERRITLYALVYEINMADGEKIFGPCEPANKDASFRCWVRVKRGAIDIDPGAEVSVSLTIEVNLAARPGKYYAGISFSPGSNITMAEDNLRAFSQPAVTINLEVEDETVERLERQDFSAEKNIFFAFPVVFDTNVSNAGNVAITPRGSIYVYNRRSQEVAKIPFNAEGRAVAPGAREVFKSAWEGGGLSMGKFKATLEAEYGEKGRRDLMGTVYFWIMPRYLALVLGGGLFLSAVMLTVIIFRKTYRGHPSPHHFPHPRREPVVNLKKKND